MSSQHFGLVSSLTGEVITETNIVSRCSCCTGSGHSQNVTFQCDGESSPSTFQITQMDRCACNQIPCLDSHDNQVATDYSDNQDTTGFANQDLFIT